MLYLGKRERYATTQLRTQITTIQHLLYQIRALKTTLVPTSSSIAPFTYNKPSSQLTNAALDVEVRLPYTSHYSGDQVMLASFYYLSGSSLFVILSGKVLDRLKLVHDNALQVDLCPL